jgi:aconitase A
MNISVDKLLAKMQEELNQAKSCSKQEHLREKVYSIKILCELLLDEKQTNSVTAFHTAKGNNQQTLTHPISINQPKKLKMDDEANGDSLLDF